MGLLYEKYASPKEFMRVYIDQGRFGEFVSHIWQQAEQEKRAAFQKEEDMKLWIAYVHSGAGKTFNEWKAELIHPAEPISYAMTDSQVEDTIERSREILSRTKIR